MPLCVGTNKNQMGTGKRLPSTVLATTGYVGGRFNICQPVFEGAVNPAIEKLLSYSFTLQHSAFTLHVKHSLLPAGDGQHHLQMIRSLMT